MSREPSSENRPEVRSRPPAGQPGHYESIRLSDRVPGACSSRTYEVCDGSGDSLAADVNVNLSAAVGTRGKLRGGECNDLGELFIRPTRRDDWRSRTYRIAVGEVATASRTRMPFFYQHGDQDDSSWRYSRSYADVVPGDTGGFNGLALLEGRAGERCQRKESKND